MRKTSGHWAEAGNCLCPFQELAVCGDATCIRLASSSLCVYFSCSEVREQASGWGKPGWPVCFGLDGGFCSLFLYTMVVFPFFPFSLSNPVFHLSGQQPSNKVNRWPELVGPTELELGRPTWKFPSLGFNFLTQTCLCLNTHPPMPRKNSHRNVGGKVEDWESLCPYVPT